MSSNDASNKRSSTFGQAACNAGTNCATALLKGITEEIQLTSMQATTRPQNRIGIATLDVFELNSLFLEPKPSLRVRLIGRGNSKIPAVKRSPISLPGVKTQSSPLRFSSRVF
ncbi:hypothetical protein QEM13_001849 [Pseudomonas putida]|nr:hypothetical protein [Pseudomonas putida]